MKILFVDTETSGMIDFKSFLGAEHQPWLVQLAALVTNEEGDELDSYVTLIKPEGWVVDPKAEEVHGISTQRAIHEGVQAQEALTRLCEMAEECDMVVAHNIKFDSRILDCAFYRAEMKSPFTLKSAYCTMKATTNLCQLPGNFGKFKWPKLAEAYMHFFEEDLEGAHDALVDVRACKRIFFKLVEMGI